MDIIESARVSRAEYIGVEGYSFSPEVYNSQGFNSQNLADYTQIQTPQEFVFTDTDEPGASLSNRHLTDKDEMSVRVGVIGCGRWGATHLRTLADLRSSGKFRIHACIFLINKWKSTILWILSILMARND